MGRVGQTVSYWVNECLIALASILSGVASISLAWLWFKWHANYIWVHQHIIVAKLDDEDPDYFNVKGMMVFDTLLSKSVLGQDFGVSRVLDYWGPAFNLNKTAREAIKEIEDRCGYTDYIEENLTFPPSGFQPVEILGAFRYGDYDPE
ncbi:putative serine carboxypeptidase ARB_06414 [Colletotrichum liriopes]|uniref:Serine carboxypeptidase ARB_06414 n=1 Tax=Colletotrichum liriopes TaxID=708192 RepID=A0AA37GSM8_9PEZI|nr:putative serine carboxypeptidase ARB_06414 [Colletotrichum liriopes]